jgi:hypothetical protein
MRLIHRGLEGERRWRTNTQHNENGRWEGVFSLRTRQGGLEDGILDESAEIPQLFECINTFNLHWLCF